MRLVRSLRRALCCAALLFSVPQSSWASGSFFYFVHSPCASDTACARELWVYDAVTAGVVTKVPLPGATSSSRVRLTRDGRRLLVSVVIGGSWSLEVIDTSTHAMIATYSIANGLIAPGRDPNEVYVSASPTMVVYDLRNGGIVRSFPLSLNTAQGDSAQDLAASLVDDRVFQSVSHSIFDTRVQTYDGLTGALLSEPTRLYTTPSLYVSPNGQRLYQTFDANLQRPSQPGQTVVDNLSGGAVPSYTISMGLFAHLYLSGAVESFASLRNYVWRSTAVWVHDAANGSDLGTIPLTGPAGNVAVSSDDSRLWVTTYDQEPSPTEAHLSIFDAATNQLLRTFTLPSVGSPMVATRPDTPTCSYALNARDSSWTGTGGTATVTLSTGCTWVASSDATWAHIDKASGAGNATFMLTVDPYSGVANRTATITIGGQLVTVTQAGVASAPPIGFVDTPTDNVGGVTGALNVSGWALDDVGVARVRVYRDPVAGEPAGALVFIGDATFVDGARPDVQAMFASVPFASRAGWGLQVLTNMLPAQGNGIYRLVVVAEDLEGHAVQLGARTITCSNAMATLPFGTIDTPGGGQTVSGAVINFGWALSPQPNLIPLDGSTIDVVIDGQVVGHPVYGFARADVDAGFPGYQNTGRAVGYFVLDTTTLSNGLHISWTVRDDHGNAQGIGSRFFRVQNP